MLQTLWKLTFLTGVVGIGLLVVWWAKNGMQLATDPPPANTAITSTDPDTPAPPAKGVSKKKSDAAIGKGVVQTAGVKNTSASSKNPRNEKKLPAAENPFDDTLPDDSTPAETHPVAARKDGYESKKGVKLLTFLDDQPKSAPDGRKPNAGKGSPPRSELDLPESLDLPTTEEEASAKSPGIRGTPFSEDDQSEVRPAGGRSLVVADARPDGKAKPRAGSVAPVKSAAADGADPFAVEKPGTAGLRIPAATDETTVSPSRPAISPTPATTKPAVDSGDSSEVIPVRPSSPPRQPVPAGEEESLPVVPRGTSSNSLPPAGPPPSTTDRSTTGRTTIPGFPPSDETESAGVPTPSAEKNPGATTGLPSTPVTPAPTNSTPVLPSLGPTPSMPDGSLSVLPRQPEKATIVPVPKSVAPETPQPRQRPRVKIEKVAPPNATLGQSMIYHIHVKNTGEVAAHQVTVEDTVPKGVNLDGTIPQAELVGDVLTWRMGTLEPHTEKKISIRVVPVSEGEVGSVATVKFSAEPGPLPAGAAPRLEFQLIGPPQTTLGSQTTFTFRVANVGRADAHRVVIQNVLPPALRHSDGDDLEYEIGLLPAGKSKEVSLALTASKLGRTINRAVVTADGGISVSAESPLEVVSPNVSIQRSGPPRILLSRQGTFTNTVTNASTQALQNLTLNEVVPAGFEFVSATNEGRFDSTKKIVSWTVDQLGPQQSRSVFGSGPASNFQSPDSQPRYGFG